MLFATPDNEYRTLNIHLKWKNLLLDSNEMCLKGIFSVGTSFFRMRLGRLLRFDVEHSCDCIQCESIIIQPFCRADVHAGMYAYMVIQTH